MDSSEERLEADTPDESRDPSLDELLRHIGRRMLELREMQDLPLSALAEFTGIDHRELLRIEKGKRNLTVKTADRIARAIGVHTYELFIPRELSTIRPKQRRRRKG
jgi:transcriptional regulator with XRE-family HTH domain